MGSTPSATRDTPSGSAGRDSGVVRQGATGERKRKNTVIKDRTRKNVYIENEVCEKLQAAMEKDDTESFSEFANRALKFYIGFLNTERAESYLLATFQAAINGAVTGTERRLQALLTAILVESRASRILAGAAAELSPEQQEKVVDYSEERAGESIRYLYEEKK